MLGTITVTITNADSEILERFEVVCDVSFPDEVNKVAANIRDHVENRFETAEAD